MKVLKMEARALAGNPLSYEEIIALVQSVGAALERG